MLHFETYDRRVHGDTGRVKRRRSSWDALFEQVAQKPQVVKEASRASIYQAAQRRGIQVRVEQLVDGDGYVVSAR